MLNKLIRNVCKGCAGIDNPNCSSCIKEHTRINGGTISVWTAMAIMTLLSVRCMATPPAGYREPNIEADLQKKAITDWQSGTNYLSASNFAVMVESVTKFDDLKAALLAKAKSDADKEAKESKAKGKK